MAQPPNLLIASRREIAQRFIDKARRLELSGEPQFTEDARSYRKVATDLIKTGRKS